MKTAVLTDLHANREAVEAVLDHAERKGARSYALLGDFVGYGADPAWVVDRVRHLVAAGAVAVQGNHDRAAVLGASPNMRDEPRRAIDWTRAQLSGAQIDFLAGLPLADEAPRRLYVHSNAWAPAEWHYIVSAADAARSMRATQALVTFCGHVHAPMLFHSAAGGRSGDFVPTPGRSIALPAQRQWLVQPGSVGQPRDGDPAAAYVMFDDEEVRLTFWRVPYDHDTAAAKIRAAGLPLALAARLQHGL
jgi:diadenosine tetraphosphatase ApaH/serine/threonine PP2A family protein phosphatase